jgi:hypothetical protein
MIGLAPDNRFHWTPFREGSSERHLTPQVSAMISRVRGTSANLDRRGCHPPDAKIDTSHIAPLSEKFFERAQRNPYVLRRKDRRR